jgi:DNA polymerase elongation subunit (family B)
LLQKTITNNIIHLEQLKKLDPEEKLHIQKLVKRSYTLKDATIAAGALIKLIEDNNWTISASGAFYRTDQKSIACEVLEDWFNQREHYRALKKKAGKKEDWANYKLYDLYQMAFKNLAKTLYMVHMQLTLGALQMDSKYVQPPLQTADNV